MRGDLGVILSCPDQKKGYADRKTAKVALAEVKRGPRPEGKLTVYQCDHCGFWHLGHMPEWKRNGLERPEGYGLGGARG